MNPESPFPRNIERTDAERQIRETLAAVSADGQSRAVLLVGDGGVGKTSLVRRLAESNVDLATDWLTPIDVDDSHYWLLSNLESKITDLLPRPGRYFDDYTAELSRLPDYTRENISRETVVSYVGRVKETFAKCYNDYVAAERKTVVITFDTIETIRGTNQLSTLTQWMKALPSSTLFILSGRRAPGASEPDPVEAELDNPYQRIPVSKVNLRGFEYTDSLAYITDSFISDDLTVEQKDKLIHLTRGQPLWLAFVVDYLTRDDIPDEAKNSLDYIEHNLPYDDAMSQEGERLHQAFLRHLLAPYRRSDFWHEAIKRLAVVRQPVDELVWQLLMNDLALPEGTEDLGHAWKELLSLPWIRSRGNGKYVTLHDAVAEAFAQRIFPLHDPDQKWRHGIWARALRIYTGLAEEKARELTRQEDGLRSRFAGPRGEPPSFQDSEIIADSLAVDALKRERDELRATRVYYLSLTDFALGCELFLHYFQQAQKEHDLFIQDLLALYLQRFLPGGAPAGAFDDVIKVKLNDFRHWLTNERPDFHVAIGIMLADYLIEVGRSEAALAQLNQLPNSLSAEFRYRIHILRGNACMRIPRRVTEGLPHFESALAVAGELEPVEQRTLTAKAHKERGYYYRNIGEWDSADDAYRLARDTLARESGPTELEELASIQANWAYVKGLAGSYDEGIYLADNAIKLRQLSGGPVQLGISWSIKGEVYRYAKRFGRAWAAYATAERQLHESPHWTGLGLIYQEQAICLYQALLDDISLTEDPMAEAKRLITSALDICLNHSIRGYPSALNRAGRIFGHDDPVQGFAYLEKGIVQAHRLSDGWFLLANQVEYADLNYRAWLGTGDHQYLSKINEQASTITEALGPSRNRFPDLAGRWAILLGNLALGDYLSNRNAAALPTALEHYKRGFPAIAQRPVASSGKHLVPAEFESFERLFSQLPPEVQGDWQTRLMAAWRGPDEGSKLLRARLEELLTRLLLGR